MSTVTVNGPEAARTLRDLVAEESSDSEQRRTLTARTVDALWESGLMQWANPTEAGGCEPTFAEMIDTWIELAWQDGSLGWIGIANLPSAAACAAYLPDEGFDEVFTAPRQSGDRRRPVLPQRAWRDRGGRLPDHRRLELRLGHGTRRVRGRRVHAHGQRRDGPRRRRASRRCWWR